MSVSQVTQIKGSRPKCKVCYVMLPFESFIILICGFQSLRELTNSPYLFTLYSMWFPPTYCPLLLRLEMLGV